MFTREQISLIKNIPIHTKEGGKLECDVLACTGCVLRLLSTSEIREEYGITLVDSKIEDGCVTIIKYFKNKYSFMERHNSGLESSHT